MVHDTRSGGDQLNLNRLKRAFRAACVQGNHEDIYKLPRPLQAMQPQYEKTAFASYAIQCPTCSLRVEALDHAVVFR
jgi:hypothetical protein